MKQHPLFFQRLVRTLTTLVFLTLCIPQLALSQTTMTTTLRVPVKDTVFQANMVRPEWVAITGLVQATLQIVIPTEPCISGDPCRNLNVAGRATLINAQAVGLTSGQVYRVTGTTNFNTTTSVPGNLTVQLDYTLISGGAPIRNSQTLTLSMALTAQATASTAVVQPSLISWWRAEGNAADAVGSNSGTLLGAVTFVPGKVGQAFHFDGESSLIEVPTAPSLEPQALTTMLWMRSDIPQPATYLLSKGASACNADSAYAFYTAGNLSFYISDGLPDSFSSSPVAEINLWDGNWHHLAGTYDNNTVRLFIDGIEQGTGSPAAIAAINYAFQDNQTLRIGGYASSCNRFLFNGDIDEVQIFSRALSTQEIQAIYLANP